MKILKTFPVLVDACGNHDMNGELELVLYRSSVDAENASTEAKLAHEANGVEGTVSSSVLMQMLYYLEATDQLDEFKEWANLEGIKLPSSSGEILNVIQNIPKKEFECNRSKCTNKCGKC